MPPQQAMLFSIQKTPLTPKWEAAFFLIFAHRHKMR
jgi:hypothetical protein